MIRVAVIVLALLFVGLLLAPAFAQTRICGPMADVLADFAKRYQEAPVFKARTSDGRLLIILKSRVGSWTAVEVQPGIGALMVCIVRTGDYSEMEGFTL